MNRHLLTAYHRLPAPVRTLAASGWGWYLGRWRFGPDTERLVAAALERETWSASRWRTWREERLAFVLHRAATTVPFYRDQWTARRRRGDRSSWESLENWPILDKGTLREHPTAFVADDCDPRRMFRDHTSGTSGTPLTTYLSRQTVRAWYALVEARWRMWYGVTRADHWAMLGGQVVAPVDRRTPPFWVWNASFRQLYMSSYHLAADLVPHYLDAMAGHRVTYALGYSSSLHALACAALRLGRRDIRLKVAIANAEPLYAYQRDAISRAFDCPVRETYGMSEAVAAAGECEHGHLHVWPEVGELEVLDAGDPVPAGQPGDLICTSLLNADMPLIRYRVGDRGSLAPDTPCGCGRRLPRLASVEGRIDDVLYTKDGRSVGRLDPVFKGDVPLVEAQIVQDRLDSIRIRYVPGTGFSEVHRHSLTRGIQERMGDVAVVLEEVAAIPRTAQGKFRGVVCGLSAAERRQLDAVESDV